MPRGHGKGSEFERYICREFSNWWTDGERDDIFWRSDTSGARAKFRSKQGKLTFGQHGDIQAIDPIGVPLTRLCTIELKRGYGNASIGDMLDVSENMATQTWERFVRQVREDQVISGTPYWMLITKRDCHKVVIFIPWDFYLVLAELGTLNRARPFLRFRPGTVGMEEVNIFGTTLDEFFRRVSSDTICELAGREGKRR